MMLLLPGGTHHGGHGCGNDIPLTLVANQIENESPNMGDALAAYLSRDQRGGCRWGYLQYPI